MTSPDRGTVLDSLYAFFSHARFARVMSACVLATVFLGFALRALIGWPGYVGILVTEVLLMVLVVLTRRRQINFGRALPLSLALFLVWCAVSTVWSLNPLSTVLGLVLQWSLAFLALSLAATRDSIQIIRAIGSVLRIVLGLSLGLEVLSGIVLGVPIPAWNIAGEIAQGSPIQGIAGSRNALATLAILGLVTFIIELRTKSVSKRVGVFSIVGAAIVLVLTQSPIGFATALIVLGLVVTIWALRSMPDAVRSGTQWIVAAAVVVVAIVVWVFRAALVTLFSAQGTMHFRVELWQRVWTLIQAKPLQGWGFVGVWPPRSSIWSMANFGISPHHDTALNSYLDVIFQVGLIGLVCLGALLGFAMVRSWLLATSRKSETFVWFPLALATILVTSLVESTLFFEWGWVLVVLISARSSSELSWRRNN